LDPRATVGSLSGSAAGSPKGGPGPALPGESDACLPMNPHPYLFLATFFFVAVAFPFVPLGLARIWAIAYSPRKPGPGKNATYECGLESKGDPLVRFRSDYYLYGILFLVFDVESVFLLPFAVKFLELPLGAVLAMLLFVLLLVEGLAWAWLKGILSWK
jgi:NADH-quinone oxidoreductase subunit A